ncbi:MAG: alpha/beta fold hydrolase [Bacteroidales bacterium]
MSYLEKNIRFIGNNHKVSYYDEGADNAPVIILIHGFPFNKSMWKKQIDLLIDNSRVIAYDIRGHGNSDAGNEEFTIDLFVKDLLLLMDALKIDQATLCGLSMGGYIALNAIENHPNCFNALILSDTHCIADTPEVKEKRMKAIRNIQENGVEQFAADMINSLFASESLITKKDEMAMVRTMITNTAVQTLVNT